MTTGQDFANLTTSRLITRQDLKERLLEHLRESDRELTKKVYPDSAVFYEDMTLLPGSVNDTFTIGAQPTPPEVTDGLGNILDLGSTTDSSEVDVPFENDAAAPTYWVGLSYVERPQGIVINPRTGASEYTRIIEDIGVAEPPDSVVDNGGTITFNVNAVTEASHSHAGRFCAVYKVVPEATTEAEAIEVVAVSYSAPNNTITTAGTLGQATVSTAASDYVVVMLGPIIRKTDISATTGVCFVGTITGNGPAAIPSVFDITGQKRIDATLSGLNTILDNFTKQVDEDGGVIGSSIGMTKRTEASAAVHGGQVYLMGGRDTTAAIFLTTNESYNPVTKTWTTKAAIPASSAVPTFAGRRRHRAETVGDTIFVIGGEDGTVRDVIQAYNALTNTWEGTDRTAMTGTREAHASGVINGLIYISHGTDNGAIVLPTAEVYDPILNTSTAIAMPPNPRTELQHQCAVLDGKLYVVGGRDGALAPANEMYAYDPTLDSWAIKAPIEADTSFIPGAAVVLEMVNGNVEVINGVLHAVFGRWTSSLSVRPFHMMYNYKQDNWRPFASRHRPYSAENYQELITPLLNIPAAGRRESASAVVDGRMYIMTGLDPIGSGGDFAYDSVLSFDGSALEIANNAGVVAINGKQVYTDPNGLTGDAWVVQSRPIP